jgi:hypothetical protein
VEEVTLAFTRAVLVGACALSFGQNVGVRPEQFKKICQDERAANIDLSGVQRLGGRFRDQSGAAFSSSYAVEVRDPATGRNVKTSVLDSNGEFEFVQLSFGRVNLLLVLMKDGRPTRTGFESPQWLECKKSEECKLDVVLKPASTDQTKYQCPLI